MIITDPGSYLELDDGRPAVRFERIYDHPIERVWALVTEPAELAHWFPSPEVTIELRTGGLLTFTGDPYLPEAQTTGQVLELDPPRLLAFSWLGDELRFELRPVDEHRTRFTLTNVLEARNTAARNAAGWHACLACLDASAAGRPTGGPHADDQPAGWEKLYDEYVAAGMPSGAPVPGRDETSG